MNQQSLLAVLTAMLMGGMDRTSPRRYQFGRPARNKRNTRGLRASHRKHCERPATIARKRMQRESRKFNRI